MLKFKFSNSSLKSYRHTLQEFFALVSITIITTTTTFIIISTATTTTTTTMMLYYSSSHAPAHMSLYREKEEHLSLQCTTHRPYSCQCCIHLQAIYNSGDCLINFFMNPHIPPHIQLSTVPALRSLEL